MDNNYGVFGYMESLGGGICIHRRYEVVEHTPENWDYADRINATYETFETMEGANNYAASKQKASDSWAESAIDREFSRDEQ